LVEPPRGVTRRRASNSSGEVQRGALPPDSLGLSIIGTSRVLFHVEDPEVASTPIGMDLSDPDVIFL
jgi:hypothetical protein